MPKTPNEPIKVRKEKVGVLENSDLGFTAPCRDISFHPSYHAFAAISYQPGAGLSIWRHDKALARSKDRTRLSIQPNIQTENVPTKVYSKPLTVDQKKHFDNLPPLPEPIFGSNFNRVKSQFDLALERMQQLSQSETSINQHSAMTLNELNTTNRNLFPSSGLDKSTASAPSGQIETDLEKMKTASSSLRFSVQNRLNQKNTVDSQIRNVYQIIQPFSYG